MPDLTDQSGGLSNRSYFNFVRWGTGVGDGGAARPAFDRRLTVDLNKQPSPPPPPPPSTRANTHVDARQPPPQTPNPPSYINWKVAARHVTDPAARTALCRRVGELLLPVVAPGEAEALRREAAQARGGGLQGAAPAALATRLGGRHA